MKMASRRLGSKAKTLTTHEFCLFMKALESEGNCAAAQALRFFIFSGVKMIRLPYMTWSGVDLVGKNVGIALPPTKSGYKVQEYFRFGEMAWCVLLERLAFREKEEERVFLDTPGGNLMSDIRKLITRVARRAGLQGRRIDIHAIKRSLADGNHFMNRFADMDLARSDKTSHSTIAEILSCEVLNYKRIRLPGDMKFRELPSWVRKDVIDYAIRRKLQYDWPDKHPSFQKGKSEALKWVFDATFEDIYIVSEGMPSPTYQGLTAESFTRSDIDTLCISSASELVAELLKVDGLPPATEENIQFEAGLHLTIESILTLLLRLYDIITEDYGSIAIIDTEMFHKDFIRNLTSALAP